MSDHDENLPGRGDLYDDRGEEQASELDQMHQEFKEFQKQQALKREKEREARARGEPMSHLQQSMSQDQMNSSKQQYQPPHVRNPNMSRASQQMEEEMNQSKGGQIMPLQEENLQSLFIKEPKSSSRGNEERDITDNYLFKKPVDDNLGGETDQQVKPFDTKAPASGGKEHLSFGEQRQSHQQPASMRGSNRDLADPYAEDQRRSLRSGRRTNDHEDSQNFGAMQNNDDRLRLEEFIRGDSTSLSKANRSFAEDVQRENSIKEFSAAKNPGSRPGSRAGLRGSERESRRSTRGDGEPPVEIDRIVVEKSPRKERASLRQGSESRGRRSDHDSKLYERAGSMSSIGKGSGTKDLVPFVDEKLSNINDTRMSNALQPRRHQDNNQSISVLANVFDQIDPTNPKDSVKKIEESMYDMQNESKASIKPHGENSKENDYGSPSHRGNDTGNFALHNSNNSRSHHNSGLGGSNAHNQSRGARGSLSKQPDNFYEPRETFNPNDYDKLRIHQSLDNQIIEKEPVQEQMPPGLKNRFPTEEELAKMDKRDLDRLMEERMDMIMAQQRQAAQPVRREDDAQNPRHQTPFFAVRDEDPAARGQQQNPSDHYQTQPSSGSLGHHARQLSNSRKERPTASAAFDHHSNFSVGQVSRGEGAADVPSIHSIDRESLNIQTPQQSAPEEPRLRHQPPGSTPKEASVSYPSQYSTERHDNEQFGEQFRAWQQQKQEEMQLKKDDYFSREAGAEPDRAPSRKGPPMPYEYDQRSQQRPNDSFSNNSQAPNDLLGHNTQPMSISNHHQDEILSQSQKSMPMLHPQKQVYPQHHQSVNHPAVKNAFQPMSPQVNQGSGRPGSNSRGEYQPPGSRQSMSDPWSAQQRNPHLDSTQNRNDTSRNSSVGSRMSAAGRNQKFADGRQSRSNSRGRHEQSEISSVSIIKSPKVERQNERDLQLDMKRKRMAEDMAKAQEAQRQLDELAKKKRQEEQRKLFQDIQNTKFGQQLMPAQKSRITNVKSRSRSKHGFSEADDFGDDEEFNDIDEGTIKAGGPQNHRRGQNNQGPLNQRNLANAQQVQDFPEDDAQTLDTRKQQYRVNNRGMKILRMSNQNEKREPSPLKDQQIAGGKYGPQPAGAGNYRQPAHYGTEPQLKQGGGRQNSPFVNQNNFDDNYSDSRTQQVLPVSHFQGGQKQANEELFNRVMQEKDPKQALHRYVMRDRNSFDMYKDSMDELNKRIDRELSNIRKQSKVADRLIEKRRASDQNLQKYQDHLNKQRMQDEMRECTFQPQVASTQSGDFRQSSQTRRRSPAQFHQAEVEFVQRKQNWINEQKMKGEEEFQRMQQTKFVNEESKKILKARRPSNTSGSNIAQHNQTYGRSDSRASSRSPSRSKALDDILNRSGESRFKFFNGSQQQRANSRAGSKASRGSGSNSRGSRIAGLQQYSGVEKRQLSNNSRSPMRGGAPGQQPTASTTSDQYLIMQLHREFQDVVQNHVYERKSLHIEDILQDMGFIDEKIVSNQQTRLGIMLRQQRNNLLLTNQSGSVMSEETDEITQNLFKVLCAIMNLKPANRAYQQLDQNLLNSYLSYIDLNKDDQDILILEQLATIKSLINRQPYSLGDNQVFAVHKKFANLYQNRKNAIETNKKIAFDNRAADQNKGMFQPQIDYKSAQYKPQTSVYDRSQEFRKGLDRDPRDIEYEKQQQHCTFKPVTNKSRPWQGNRPNSRAGNSRAGSRARGDSRGSGTGGNSSITRQRFGPTNHTATSKRNDSASRFQQVPGNRNRKSSPNNAIPNNQFVTQPSKATDPEPFSESDPSFQQNYLGKNVNETAESSLSLNPQKFHDRQQKQSKMHNMQQQQPQAAQTIDDPDTYIGARETYKDEVPSVLRTPTQSVQSHTRAMPRVKQAQAISQSLNKSNGSSGVPPSDLLQSQTGPQNYMREPLFMEGMDQPEAETNSMVNDSFGPATMDQAQVMSQVPDTSEQQPKSTKAVDERYLQQDASATSRQGGQSSRLPQRVPICVLKIELDRQNVEEIRVYEGEDPNKIVSQFGSQFNLTENAMIKLHAQIMDQIRINQSKQRK